MFSKLDNFQLSLLIGHFDSSLHWMRFRFSLWFRFLHLICVQIQILGSLKSVNLFDGQFTCWAICLKYHILTYGHITAGLPENLSSPCCFHGCCNQKFSAHRDGLHCLLAAGLSSRCLPISGWAPAFGGLPFVAADSTSSSRPLRRSAVSATRPPGSNTPRTERRT